MSNYKLKYIGKLTDVSNSIIKAVDDPEPQWEELDLLVRNIYNEQNTAKKGKLLDELAATAIKLRVIHT